MRINWKKWSTAGASAASAVVLVTVLAVPAQASTHTKPAPPPTTSVTAPLEIDCSTITDQGREYAVVHNLNVCGILSTTNGGVSTFASPVYNNCGSASIDISSSGSGNAMIVWSIHSTQGWILWYGVTVTYSGSARAGSVGFSGVPVNINAGDYTSPYVGSGWASASLSGSVETVLWTCSIAYPSDMAYI